LCHAQELSPIVVAGDIEARRKRFDTVEPPRLAVVDGVARDEEWHCSRQSQSAVWSISLRKATQGRKAWSVERAATRGRAGTHVTAREAI
jgi:hypothetical protein